MKTIKEIKEEFEKLEGEKQKLQQQLNQIQINQIKLQGQFELLEKKSEKEQPNKG